MKIFFKPKEWEQENESQTYVRSFTFSTLHVPLYKLLTKQDKMRSILNIQKSIHNFDYNTSKNHTTWESKAWM
jgi:hypothetical protein